MRRPGKRVLPHQRLALRAQNQAASVSLEQHDAERLLHFADGMAHGAGRQMEFRSRGLKRIPPTRSLEYAQLRYGDFGQHEQ